jgi:phosphinothricin acetyltransferase
MDQVKIKVRPSTDDDVPMMMAIYKHHIEKGVGDLGTYDTEPLDANDLKQRRKNMKNHRLPHLVAECEGTVGGYAYAVPFRKRPAYRFTLKHSIYVHPGFVNSGIGRVLLPALIDACAEAGYRQLIGYIDAANEASIKLHLACGFRQVGLLPSVAFKFGHWSDSVLVQRELGPGDKEMPSLWVGKASPPKPTPSPTPKVKKTIGKISGW